jgi:hypothetical protein
LWIYLTTGSVARFALFAVLALVPGMLLAPVAGAVIDRISRRWVMLCASAAAGAVELVATALLLSGRIAVWHLYVLVAWLSVALTFQRLAFVAAVPQLVPPRYLGRANGVVQLVAGLTQFLVPLIAVALLAAVELRGVLILDVVSFVVAVGILVAVPFPATPAVERPDSIRAEITGGLRYALRERGFRSMLAFFAALNLFLFPVLFLFGPLVLGFAGLAEVAQVAVAGGIGAVAGGLAMALWGGPRRRMRGVLGGTFGVAAACVLTGLRPNLVVVATGAFGLYFALAIVNGAYATIVQAEVPASYHGRVFAINQMIAWSTLPLGWGVLAPLATSAVEPLLQPDGALAHTVGAVIGVGPGRGIGLLYLVSGACVAVLAAASLRNRHLAQFDADPTGRPEPFPVPAGT